MISRSQLAIDYFKSGYNCSQAIVLAFKDLIDVDENTLLKISSPFGGGMGRLREVCGAVSGMFMVLGLLYGYNEPDDDKKKELYARVQQLARKFEEDNGSIVCRELLGLSVKHDDPTPSKRTSSFYQNRPCPEKIGYAAELLNNFIINNPIIK